MYYPVGWQKTLKLDLEDEDDAASTATYPHHILSVQPNRNRELFLILTNKSLHLWYSKPALEIVCHRRSAKSIEELGYNVSTVWRFDSNTQTGTVVVSTSIDQLLFYQIRPRIPTSTSTATFLLPRSLSNGDANFKIRDIQSNRKGSASFSAQMALDPVPALTLYLDGKLDFSDMGISCLMAAGQRIIVASLKYSDIHGVLWDGSADKDFPWTLKNAHYQHAPTSNIRATSDSLSQFSSFNTTTSGNLRSSESLEGSSGYHSPKDINFVSSSSQNPHPIRKFSSSPNSSYSATSENSSIDEMYYQSGHRYCPYVIDIKYSSAHAGFALVFSSGRAAFLPIIQIASDDVDSDKNSVHKLNNNGNSNGSMNGVHSTYQSATNSRRDSIISSISELELSCNDTHPPVECNSHNRINPPIGDNRNSSRRTMPSKTVINYVPGIDNATCTEINHKFRLIAYGLNNSQVIVCNIDEVSRFAVVNHRLILASSRFPDAEKKTGSITNLRYTPDNHALFTVWEKGGFAMWSVFGSLLFSSLSWETNLHSLEPSMTISSLCWGREGYNLWVVVNFQEQCQSLTKLDQSQLNETSSEGQHSSIRRKDKIMTFSFAKASLMNSPHITCTAESVLLLSEDRLYVGQSVSQDSKLDDWNIVQLPQSYTNVNWPIRYATIDRFGKNVAIAGKYGFAIYSLINCKWKLFGNETQEKDLTICGDMIWWFDYIVVACHNIMTNHYEIRAYSNKQRLDNNFATITLIAKKIVLMSIFENRLLALYSDGQMEMFLLNLRQIHHQSHNKIAPTLTRSASFVKSLQYNNSNNKDLSTQTNNYTLQIVPFDSLVVSNLKANPSCLSSITLTRLHFENTRTDDSILLNACGKLFLLERDPPSKLSTSASGSNLTSSGPVVDSTMMGNNNRLNQARVSATSMHFAAAALESTETIRPCAVTFRAVSVLATNVEHYWISPDISLQQQKASYLTKSLWLLSGGQNDELQSIGPLKVWLPLLQNNENPRPPHQYMPERIMLPIKCNNNIYPLSILFNDAIILGAENDTILHSSVHHYPFSILNRQSQVYLHRILRELLRRNLGCHAWEIAKSYEQLAYFAHSFELLLHEVLEEEASSAQPLPDPLLPLVVKFIEEFPMVYLETVVHCARKSELAMWPHLFSVVGNPRRLFQRCLKENKLDTAASCLIILQSFERNTVSHQMVSELLLAAKNNSSFHYLLKDLECFLERAQLNHTIKVDSQQV